MLEQITTPVEGVPTRKEITITSNSTTGIKGSAPFSILQAEIQTQKRFPGKYQGDALGGSNKVFNRESAAGSSDDRTSRSTEQMVYAPPRKPHAKGKGHKRGGSTRWTDEESEALLEAVEIHGDDAHAVKADPEFAARLSRRTEESIKLKMERENMFGDSDGAGEESAGEEEGEEREGVGDAVEDSSAKTADGVGGEMDVEKIVVEKEKEEISALNNTATRNQLRNGKSEAAAEPADAVVASGAPAVGKGEDTRAKPLNAVRSDSASVASAALAKPSSATASPRGTSSSAASASLPDDVSVASSHRSASSRVTSSSTAATAMSSRSSPRYGAVAEQAPVEKPVAKSSAADTAIALAVPTAAASSTPSTKKAAAPLPMPNEAKPKTKNFELKSLLSDNIQPLPPRRKGPPPAAVAPASASAPSPASGSAFRRTPAQAQAGKCDSDSGSDDEAETIQVPRVLTRRQEQEQEQALLSTRSGKKLYLAGSDLLP